MRQTLLNVLPVQNPMKTPREKPRQPKKKQRNTPKKKPRNTPKKKPRNTPKKKPRKTPGQPRKTPGQPRKTPGQQRRDQQPLLPGRMRPRTMKKNLQQPSQQWQPRQPRLQGLHLQQARQQGRQHPVMIPRTGTRTLISGLFDRLVAGPPAARAAVAGVAQNMFWQVHPL